MVEWTAQCDLSLALSFGLKVLAEAHGLPVTILKFSQNWVQKMLDLDLDNDLSWLTQEPLQPVNKKKKIFHLKKASDLIQSSGNKLSDFDNAVFKICLETQKSDLDSEVKITEFQSPEPEIEIFDDDIPTSLTIHDSQVNMACLYAF